MDAYRQVPCGDFCEYYDMLVGPDGFECLLTEPEDRNWCRDGRVVIDRLNAQHAELAALRAEVERLREERRWICVHDRLPEPYDHVLVRRFGETDKAYLTAPPQGLWYRAADDAPIDPEYWQPLPAPPAKEE